MPIDAALRSLMAHRVSVQPLQSEDMYGNPTYYAISHPSSFSFPARVVQRRRKVLDRNGLEVISEVTVYADTTKRINLQDKMTLPTDFVPNQPAIIRVNRLTDEVGLYYTEIFA